MLSIRFLDGVYSRPTLAWRAVRRGCTCAYGPALLLSLVLALVHVLALAQASDSAP